MRYSFLMDKITAYFKLFRSVHKVITQLLYFAILVILCLPKCSLFH